MNAIIVNSVRFFIYCCLALILSACATQTPLVKEDTNEVISAKTSDVKNIANNSTSTPDEELLVDVHETGKAELYKGTGSFVNKNIKSGASGSSLSSSDNVTLTFQDAPIQEVASTILGDLMGMAYVIDERVEGTVNLKTGRPIPRDALVAVIEGILKANNAVLFDNQGVFHIVPATENLSSVVAPSFKVETDKGFQTIVVPLYFIAAEEMKTILASIQGKDNNIQADSRRNLILVSGTQSELRNMLDTIEIFDVDQLKGMSTGIFRLSQSDANSVASELQAIFGFSDSGESTGGIITFVPIERINAILVVTPQARYLDTVEDWVIRLDKADSSISRSLHVYFVQNVRSAYLAGILQKLFDADVSTQQAESSSIGSIAPGFGNNEQTSFGQDSISNDASTLNSEVPSGPSSGGLNSLQRRTAFSSDFRAAPPTSDNSDSPIKIIADEENNALIVKATNDEYKEIEDAIKRLDIIPLQVLVEATIVEVSLTGDLSYGLEWFFRNNNVIDGNDGQGLLDTGGSGLASLSPGFSYSIVDSAGGVRAVLNALASDSKLRVVSSPSLMVLDNHSASINIGDQVPVRTSESTNTGTAGDDSIVTSTIQFVETGVTLEVAPRVSKGGNVVMDIFQSIRTASVTNTSAIDSPTINQRQVQTSVAVHSGDTIVLGGLIQEDNGRSNSGVPGLRNLPFAGVLFGTTNKSSTRTELLVLITPTAVRDINESKAATEELRDKLKGLHLPELESDGTIKAIDYKGIRW